MLLLVRLNRCRRHQAMSQFNPTLWSDSALQENFVEPQARKIRAWGFRQSKIVIRIRLARLPGFGGFRYFDKVA